MRFRKPGTGDYPLGLGDDGIERFLSISRRAWKLVHAPNPPRMRTVRRWTRQLLDDEPASVEVLFGALDWAARHSDLDVGLKAVEVAASAWHRENPRAPSEKALRAQEQALPPEPEAPPGSTPRCARVTLPGDPPCTLPVRRHVPYATQYARAVCRSRSPYRTSAAVHRECERHLAWLERGDMYFDEAAADRIGDFAERFMLVPDEASDTGLSPLKLHPSQEFILGSAYGWKWKATGQRVIRRVYIEQGKGNGKTPILAVCTLWGVLLDGVADPECYVVAATKEQAGVCFRDIVRFIEDSPGLAARLKPIGGENPTRVAVRDGRGFIARMSRDVRTTGSGLRPSTVAADEVHEHPDRRSIDMLERGFKRRAQPMLVMATNSGWDRASGCWEEHEHAVRCEDDATFGFVAGMDEHDPETCDPREWERANPLVGQIISSGYLAEQVKTAKMRPGTRANILRLHFCQWTEAETSWISQADWQALERPLDLRDYEGVPAVVSLDLSIRRDTTALTYTFKMPDDELHSITRCYIPREGLREKSLLDRMHYEAWAENEQHLVIHDGALLDYAAIVSDLCRDTAEIGIPVRCVAYDSFRFREFRRELDSAGLEKFLCIEHPQGFQTRKTTPLYMPHSVAALDTAIAARRLVVDVNPMVRFAVARSKRRSTTQRTDSQVFMKAHGRARIDAIVTITMGVGVVDIDDVESLLPAEKSMTAKEKLRAFWSSAAQGKSGGMDAWVDALR